MIAVRGMSEDEAIELFLHRAQRDTAQENRHQASRIVQILGYLPLALDQAGSYVSSRNLPLEIFLEHYAQRKDMIFKHRPALWEYHKHLGGHETTIPVTVFTTWELSLGQIAENEGLEAISHFLTVSAFLDSRDVEQALFCSYVASLSAELPWRALFMTNKQWDEYKFQDLLALLRGFSLIESISFRNGQARFSLHPLIGEWLRLRIPSENLSIHIEETNRIVSASIEISYDGEIDFETRSALIAHVDACLRNEKRSIKDEFAVAIPLSESSAVAFAYIYNSHSRYEDARTIYTNLLDYQKERANSLHSQTAMNLANVLRNQGKHDIS